MVSQACFSKFLNLGVGLQNVSHFLDPFLGGFGADAEGSRDGIAALRPVGNAVHVEVEGQALPVVRHHLEEMFDVDFLIEIAELRSED